MTLSHPWLSPSARQRQSQLSFSVIEHLAEFCLPKFFDQIEDMVSEVTRRTPFLFKVIGSIIWGFLFWTIMFFFLILWVAFVDIGIQKVITRFERCPVDFRDLVEAFPVGLFCQYWLATSFLYLILWIVADRKSA
ncbi:MAG: hypothetical protein AAF385_06400 [Pseudomonadota bacterium]